MASPTNVLYLGIRVEDRDANRAISSLNRNLDGVGDHGAKGGDRASRAIEQLRQQLQTAAKVPPPPVPTEKLRQLNDEMQRLKANSAGFTGSLTSGFRQAGASIVGLTGQFAALYFGLQTVKKGFELVVNAAQFAARTEQIGVALNAVARAAGLSEVNVNATAAKMEKLGFTAQASKEALSKLIAANIDYRKSLQLARVSQDLGRVAGINSTEAMQRLTHAIVTLQPEMLRTLGLSVNLEQSYKDFAKANQRATESLTEQEKRMIATNATIAAAASFNGVYVASAETAGGQALSMQRYMDDLSQAIGERLLPAYTRLIGLTKDGLKAAKDNIGVLDTWKTQWEILLLPLEAASDMFGAIKKGIDALAADPAIGIFVKTIRESFAMLGDLPAAYRGARALGERNYDREAEQRKRNESLFTPVLTELDRDALRLIQSKNQEIAEMFAKERIETEKRVAEAAEEIRKQQAEKAKQALEQSKQLLERAQLSELTGLEKINRERQIALRDMGLTAQAVRNINAAFDIQVQQENIQMARLWAEAMQRAQADYAKQQEGFLKTQFAALKTRLDFEKELRMYRLRSDEDALRSQEVTLRQEKELKLAQLEVVTRSDVQGKLALEDAKLRIEKEYLDHSIALTSAAARKKAEIEMEANPRFRVQIEEDLQTRLKDIRQNADADRALLEQRAVNEQREIVLRAWEDTYDRVKRSAEGVFDALTARSKSFGEYLKTGMLTVLKEIVTSQVARSYMALFNGGTSNAGTPVGAAPGRGGILGALLGMGGIGVSGAPGGTGGFAGPVSGGSFFGFPGAPGGTGGFTGPVGGLGGAGGGKAGLLSGFSSYKGFLSNLGNIGYGPVGGDFGGEVAGSFRGVGGNAGGGLLLGGGILAAAGLKRGGLSGLAMTAAGGALIGAKFGGPIGAVIGGAIGGLAGLVRLFGKGATEKTRDKIKAFYGIDVKDKGVLNQIVEITKSTYGGNTDMAIRSPQIRDLLELYAMSTGQKFGLNPDTVRPFVASQSAGQIFQQVQYDAGRAFTQQSSLPTLGGGTTAPIILNIDGQSAGAAWQGEVVQATIVQNSRTVAAAANSAARGNFQRRSSWIQGIAPGALTA